LGPPVDRRLGRGGAFAGVGGDRDGVACLRRRLVFVDDVGEFTEAEDHQARRQHRAGDLIETQLVAHPALKPSSRTQACLVQGDAAPVLALASLTRYRRARNRPNGARAELFRLPASWEPMRPIVLIPARLAASRLPGKPLADIGGQPMIVRVLRQAEAANVGPVAVAAGDAEIGEAVAAAGGRAVLTDPDLPSGSDRILAALATLDPHGHHDVIVNLQGDIPFLDPLLLADCVGL